jgi:cytochrome c oxidase subunit 1
MVLLGVIVFGLSLVMAATGRGRAAEADPYEGPTLEWATDSPPPPHNFDSVPEIRSALPMADLRAAGASQGGQ